MKIAERSCCNDLLPFQGFYRIQVTSSQSTDKAPEWNFPGIVSTTKLVSVVCDSSHLHFPLLIDGISICGKSLSAHSDLFWQLCLQKCFASISQCFDLP